MTQNQIGFPLLTLIIFFPLAGAAVLLALRNERAQKVWAFVVALATFIASLPLYFSFDERASGMQFVERWPWIPELNIQYFLGVDGISLFLVLLTTFLSPIVILFSWDTIRERTRSYYFFLLALETGMLGVFLSLDLVLFYVFWDAMLVPMYFLIGRWGGPRRIYAALKFFLYTAAGSALMLVAILVLYWYHGTFDLLALYDKGLPAGLPQTLGFLAFALAFAIKVPLFPFHTWLPDAHVEAPTAGSVILAGVLLKMGTYGFLRFCLPLFPQATREFVPLLSILALVGILYGALVALVQKDIKSLVAYSSVAHLGFVVLGIFALNPQGMAGAILQMVNHGLSTGALFLLVGMIYERRHTRLLSEFGGLWSVIPFYGAIFLIVMLSSVGLPGLNGFVGEFTILVGVFQANKAFAVIGTLGVILAAWYLLTAFRQMMQGPLDKPANQKLTDLTRREWAVLLPIVVLFFIIGLFPGLFFDKMDTSVRELHLRVGRPAAVTTTATVPQPTPTPIPTLPAARE